MEKAYIITLHKTFNVGSSLQAYALYKFLDNHGIDISVIDYTPKYFYDEGAPIKSLIKKILFLQSYLKRKRKFEKFLLENIKLTEKNYRTYEQLEKANLQADYFITGSDQVWNTCFCCGTDRAFYLRFARSGKKIAYAVSMGKERIEEKDLKWIGNQIQDFDLLSVREESSVNNLKKVYKKNIDCVCDPTLLLAEDEYNQLFRHDKAPLTEKYVLVYLVQKSQLLDETIAFIRKNTDWKVVLIGGFTKRCDCDIHLKDAGPEDFLLWVKYATHVIASSFHATMFSHIYRKNFSIILPLGNSVRIENFVKMMGTDNAIIRDSSGIEKVLKSINFSEEKINGFREFSSRILLEGLC